MGSDWPDVRWPRLRASRKQEFLALRCHRFRGCVSFPRATGPVALLVALKQRLKLDEVKTLPRGRALAICLVRSRVCGRGSHRPGGQQLPAPQTGIFALIAPAKRNSGS